MLGFSPEAYRKLEAHSWPGNVRELANAIEQAALLHQGPQIEPDDIHFFGIAPPAGEDDLPPPSAALAEVESWHIRRALKHHRGIKARLADSLGVCLNTVGKKLEDYSLEAERRVRRAAAPADGRDGNGEE